MHARPRVPVHQKFTQLPATGHYQGIGTSQGRRIIFTGDRFRAVMLLLWLLFPAEE